MGVDKEKDRVYYVFGGEEVSRKNHQSLEESIVAKASASKSGSAIVIPAPQIQRIEVPIIGISPLIVHAWSEKAKKMMLEKQQKKATGAKEAKDPHADFMASRYISEEGWDGVPAGGFKAAVVGACRAVSGLPMTLAKRMCFVISDGTTANGSQQLVRIEGEPRMCQHMVRLESGVADIRFRAEFVEWSAKLKLEFNSGIISAEQLVNLISHAGYSEGICEWRPSAPQSATGECGRWRVA